MEFPTEFAVKKIVFTVAPIYISSPNSYESAPMVFEVSGESTSGWFGNGSSGVSLTKEDMLGIAVEGFKYMSARLAEFTGREDAFLHSSSVSVNFFGDASDEVIFDLTPEEEEIVE